MRQLKVASEERERHVSWVGKGNDWWTLEELLFPLRKEQHGVYVIWHSGNPGRAVRVGQGNISDRLLTIKLIR